jgi:hypothetical protein
MKKKDKAPKKEDMPEFEFKQFTPEEDKIYEEAVNKFREVIAAGKSLKEAYESYSVADKELEAVIHADFLKIMIAELHFGKGKTVTETARALSVSTDLIDDTRKRMLQEAGVTAANEFGKEYGDIIPKKTND